MRGRSFGSDETVCFSTAVAEIADDIATVRYPRNLSERRTQCIEAHDIAVCPSEKAVRSMGRTVLVASRYFS